MNKTIEECLEASNERCADLEKLLQKEIERLNWLLNNRFPGPVCWYREKNGEEFLIMSREDIDKWMRKQP